MVWYVEWEKADPENADLDPCPNNGGVRIFPDKLTPDDASPNIRQEVDIVATAYPPVEGLTVYFKVWDVDDPFDQLNPSMPNVSLIDANTTGPDNRGPEAQPLPWTATGTTDAEGKARVTFTVSMQPGNNYRAAASLLQDALSAAQLDQTKADATDDDYPYPDKPGDFSGYKVPATWSQMLTVWRKLHVETDSMAAPDFTNSINGFLSSAPTYNPANGRATIPIPVLPTEFRATDQHKVGRIDIAVFGSYVTIGTTMSPPSVEIRDAPSDIADALGLPFTLWDDDAGSVPPFHMVGFDALPVTLPKIPDTGLMDSVFRNAYVDVPSPDLQYFDNDAAFDLNVVEDEAVTRGNARRNLASSADYWAVHVTSAFQGYIAKDGDPDGEQGVGGLNYGLTGASGILGTGRAGSLIFLETIRDDKRGNVTEMAVMERYTVAHEAGHQFFLEHADDRHPLGDDLNPGGDYIMTDVTDDTGMAPNVAFSANSLKKIRTLDYPQHP